MKCSICKCETDFTRYTCIAKDGHRWTWGYLCDECHLHRKQTTLAEGACIPPPAPPPSGTVDEEEEYEEDPHKFLWEIRRCLNALEEYIIHTQEGPSKPQAGDSLRREPPATCDNGGE